MNCFFRDFVQHHTTLTGGIALLVEFGQEANRVRLGAIGGMDGGVDFVHDGILAERERQESTLLGRDRVDLGEVAAGIFIEVFARRHLWSHVAGVLLGDRLAGVAVAHLVGLQRGTEQGDQNNHEKLHIGAAGWCAMVMILNWVGPDIFILLAPRILRISQPMIAYQHLR